MSNSENQGRDLVLESRQLMAVFLGISVLCGVFFALGYVVGVHTTPSEIAAQPAVTLASSSEKPSALPPATYIPRNPDASAAPNGDNNTPAPASDSDLSFYQNVQQNNPQQKLDSTPGANATPPASAAPASGTTAPAGSAPAPNTVPASAADQVQVSVVPPPAGILVQVSALSRREDAESLVQLLKGKNLPVLVTSGDNDSLFHVVLGPYKTDAAAESVKQELEQEGFRPFIRH